MTIVDLFIKKIEENPNSIQFKETIEIIERYYDYTPVSFKNGDNHNEIGENAGSSKILCFAKINQLNQFYTLNCFGDYFRVDVLEHPTATDHANIRDFIKYSWKGLEFDKLPLKLKQTY